MFMFNIGFKFLKYVLDKVVEFNLVNLLFHLVEVVGKNQIAKMVVSLVGILLYKMWNFIIGSMI